MPKRGKKKRSGQGSESADAVAARSFWSGTISFGLVSIPVYLYPAQRRERVALRMLSPDGTPLERRFFCPTEEREVSRDEIVRGYEIEKDEFVVVTDEELEALEPEKSRDIDLTRFVDVDAVDPRFFERAYFLTPAGDSVKAYRLLAAVMEETGKAGIATFVMRTKEYLVAILAEGGILRAETLRFANELRTPADVGLGELAKPPAKLVARFEKAIGELASDEIDPGELEDRYSERVRALAEKKAKKNQDVVAAGRSSRPAAVDADEDEEGGAEVIDLMEVIKRSLEAAGGAESKRRPRSPRQKSGSGRRTAAKADEELSKLSKEELYERAQEAEVPGRSSMTKAELVRALAG